MVAENQVLNKTLEKLKYLEQLRSVSAGLDLSQAPRPQAFRQSTSACFSCSTPGHFVRNCPFSRQQHDVQQPQQQNTQTQGLVSPQSSVNAMRNRRVGNRAVYPKASVGAHQCACLLDAVSEISLLPATMVDPQLIFRSSQTVKAASGTAISIMREATSPLRVGQFETKIAGLVSEHIAEVMLGFD
jgi:hypothetical protein